jgi:hypothetical protein
VSLKERERERLTRHSKHVCIYHMLLLLFHLRLENYKRAEIVEGEKYFIRENFGITKYCLNIAQFYFIILNFKLIKSNQNSAFCNLFQNVILRLQRYEMIKRSLFFPMKLSSSEHTKVQFKVCYASFFCYLS